MPPMSGRLAAVGTPMAMPLATPPHSSPMLGSPLSLPPSGPLTLQPSGPLAGPLAGPPTPAPLVGTGLAPQTPTSGVFPAVQAHTPLSPSVPVDVEVMPWLEVDERMAWTMPLEDIPPERSKQRLLIIGAGFGVELNPAQFHTVKEAGFQIHMLHGLPNPETVQFPVEQFVPTMQRAIEEFRPHCVACASKGGAYLVALWQRRLWRGPSLIINKHPTLLTLPQDVNVVLCHGSNDEIYSHRREELEALQRSGSPNRCFVYWTGNSGLLGGRTLSREGDKHNMASLVQYDCLPRLLEAAMSSEGPELAFMRSWRGFLSEERQVAEEWLGWNTQELRRLWQSTNQSGTDEQVLFEVDPTSEEYAAVQAVFYAQPTVPRAYHDMNPGMWQHVRIARIERVENGLQEDGNTEPYYRAMKRGIENQGVKFTPFVHTTWAFHGSSAVEEIVTNPISGFQPLMSGSRASALWGPGTYFARDAKYVYDGGFCNNVPDGSKQLFLCLLLTGIPCLGDPKHPGILPVRQGRHRYNSSVDSMSNPEIWVTQSPGAAYPAYIITFFS